MAFWGMFSLIFLGVIFVHFLILFESVLGAKVKAGKPYTLVHDGEITGEGRRLRITQATLARRNYSKTSKRSILECRVGSRKPVIVCSLAPNRLDSISLDLEFHEKEAVVFYVRGSVAIHLADYIPANVGHFVSPNE